MYEFEEANRVELSSVDVDLPSRGIKTMEEEAFGHRDSIFSGKLFQMCCHHLFIPIFDTVGGSCVIMRRLSLFPAFSVGK